MLGGHFEGCLVNKTENNRVFPNRMNGIKAGTEIYRNNDFQFEKTLANSKIKRRIGAEIVYRDGIITAIDDNKIQYRYRLSLMKLLKILRKCRKHL